MTHLLVLTLLLSADPPPPTTSKQVIDKLHAINLDEARKWNMFLDDAHKTKAELIERPVYLWTNPTKGGGQFGSVFIWHHAGRPQVVGSIFAHPTGGRRRITHEFHSLAPTLVSAVCDDEQSSTWQPKAAIKLEPLSDAPPPDATPTRRLIQMRSLGREFTGHTVDWKKQRWEMRLLSQPLFRYDKPQGDVIDGALLALVTDAGTDPEVLLLLEARKDARWHYALLRFTDSSAWVNHKDREIWTSVKSAENPQLHNPDFTYRVFQKQLIDEPAELDLEPVP